MVTKFLPKILGLIVVITAGVAISFFFFRDTTVGLAVDGFASLIGKTSTQSGPEHLASSIDPGRYDGFFAAADKDAVFQETQQVVSGVVPHHLVAGIAEARFFKQIAGQDPPVVVLIGPNHPQAGLEPIVTSLGYWKTPYGNLPVDQNQVKKLVEQKLVVVDEQIIGSEHAIGAVVPFIEHTWQDTRLLPLVIKENTPTSTLARLAQMLVNELPKNSLVLASVDFSHYLPEAVASFHDELSRNVLAVGDSDRVEKLEVDSQKTLYFLLEYNRLKAAQNFTLVASTNSATISLVPETAETTSHIIGYFSPGTSVETPITTLQFFGDIMLDRSVAKAMGNRGLEYLFEKLKGQENRFFYGMDLLVANLEGPFAKTRVSTTKSIAFRFDPALAPELKEYGFDVLSLANNHTLDMGWANVDFTHETLNKNDLGHFGDQIREGKEFTWFENLPATNEKIAFIGLNNTDHPLDMDKVRESITDAKAKARYVIAFMHWGPEYQRISREQERVLARQLIDLGVTTVVGAHPHVVQEIELYKGKPIFYSLGNFIFDQYFSKETQEGLSVGLVLQDGEVKKIYTFPIFGEKSQVQLMKGVRKAAFDEWVRNNSRVPADAFGVLIKQ